MRVGLWAEHVEDDWVAAALPDLARLGLRLGLALPSERVGDPSFARLTRTAADHGVPLRVWPLLPRELGYWIGEENAAQARELVGEIVRWRRSSGGPVFEGVSVDLEPAFEYSEALRHARPDRLVTLLLQHVDPQRFSAARDQLARMVDSLRRERITAHAVTFPLLLDQDENDTLLEDALDIPVSGIAWDEVSFMVYQTPFAELTGSWLGPSLVHCYARDAVARFGARAGLDLGIVGDHGVGVDPGNRYPDPSTLQTDVEAALAAGIPLERLRIYGLRGVWDSGGADHWLGREPQPNPTPPSPTRLTTGLRNGVRALLTGLAATRRR
jgi:hypothetical protein